MSEFKLFDRGAEKTALLIPGWATDYRIFNSLDLDANYLMPIEFSPLGFDEDLIEAMAKYRIDRISVIGWSMGGFIGADLLSKYKDRITDITFIGVRKRYQRDEIESTGSYLKKNKTAFLCRFYKDCFSGEEKEELSAFKAGLMKSYLNEMSMDTLLEGLQYLSTSRIRPQSLTGVDVKFIHGEEDRIAPIKEILELKDGSPNIKLVTVRGAGHIPFLRKDFREIFLA
ncbi:MAG: alpha/beta fold hydrolase [Candidatus Omnitrophota bacterium]|nr:alpha/beta fold hydrolase [Candidatus Omnitrophota bacterium]